MPNFYEEQARQRFHRAKAFVDKAHGLMLQDDLVSRSALDDAISAIKNSLQGYLMYQIAQAPSGGGQRDWVLLNAGLLLYAGARGASLADCTCRSALRMISGFGTV